MVEVARLPPGFPPPPGEAPAVPLPATSPPPGRHPLEAWAEPGPQFEPTISRTLPGGGYLNATRTALRILEADHARIAAQPRVKHASELSAEQREREAEAEAVRRAAPDPRNTLRMAHRLHAETAAEAARLRPLVERARRMVTDLEGRQRQHAAEAETTSAAATSALIEALESGEPAPPPTLFHDEQEKIAALLETATAALTRLESDMVKADDLLTRRQHGVSRCAVAVLVTEAADMADEIVRADEALTRRRADLDALARLLTSEGRRLNGPATPALPGQISRALRPADPVLNGADRGEPATDWSARYRALCERSSGHR
jgi:hypothetical protein